MLETPKREDIKKDLKDGYSVPEIMTKYNVSRGTVFNIKNEMKFQEEEDLRKNVGETEALLREQIEELKRDKEALQKQIDILNKVIEKLMK